jgi:hypothetical protein
MSINYADIHGTHPWLGITAAIAMSFKQRTPNSTGTPFACLLVRGQGKSRERGGDSVGSKHRRWVRNMAVAIMGLFLVSLFTAQPGWARDDASISLSRDEVKALLGNPDATIIDVRLRSNWDDSPIKIKGAIHEDPVKPGAWMEKYPKDRMLVLY